MNRIATTPRGFPFDELSLAEIQEQTVPVLNAIARLIPDRSIIYGCNLIDFATRVDGFILYAGEFMPFVGGANDGNFSILENVVDRTFNIGTDMDPMLEDHPAYYKRYAQIGTIVDAESVHPFTSLKPSPRFLTYLKKGTRYIGTVVPTVSDSTGTVIDVNFDTTVGTPLYMVLSNFYRANEAALGSFDFDIFGRTSTGFKIRLKNITAVITQLYFDYLIVPNGTINDGG
ncbi:MAG: hypothetical protein JJE55_08330 [Flavobacteriaceae bacterium]|nr:hypothetical protein [Flavobacteriaceae bacterium]